MRFSKFIELNRQWAICPVCGCGTVGNGTGTLEGDSEAGYFKRTFRCGFSVEYKGYFPEKER